MASPACWLFLFSSFIRVRQHCMSDYDRVRAQTHTHTRQGNYLHIPKKNKKEQPLSTGQEQCPRPGSRARAIVDTAIKRQTKASLGSWRDTRPVKGPRHAHRGPWYHTESPPVTSPGRRKGRRRRSRMGWAEGE